jgi:hypothetical protein
VRSRPSSDRPPAGASARRGVGRDDGWQAVNISRSSRRRRGRRARVEVRHARLLQRLELVPSCSCLRSSMACRRSWSIERCFAVAISQAPGLSGTPVCGQRSSAASSASCARSSASRRRARSARAGDQLRRLHPPDRLDDAIDVRGRHAYQSDGVRRAMQGRSLMQRRRTTRREIDIAAPYARGPAIELDRGASACGGRRVSRRAAPSPAREACCPARSPRA